MMERLTIDADQASRLVRDVQESAESIAKGSREFQAKAKEAYEQSDINFLQAIAAGMDNVCAQANKLNDSATELQTVLSKYIGEVADYSTDTSGLY